ncbi:MAG: DUF1963 domain-containing protein [Cyanobacteria bacterium SZAS LIN-3]|nr:DUF1963 domain-containing protein [Cyanobacteria bacterium SZAS LIN-3]
MNDELHTELRQLLLSAGPHWTATIETSLANSKVPALAMVPQDTHSFPRENASGLLGGSPSLPAGLDWPTDRNGQAMDFLLQIDLQKLAACKAESPLPSTFPSSGTVTIFRSAQILTMPDKDRKAFHINFVAGATIDAGAADSGSSQSPARPFTLAARWTLDLHQLLLQSTILPTNLSSALTLWATKYNAYTCGSGQFFGSGENLEREKEICAFAASGISHDAQRAADSHYSHLMADKDEWLLFARIDEGSLFQSGKIRHSDVLIRRQDLEEGLFERAFLLSR